MHRTRAVFRILSLGLALSLSLSAAPAAFAVSAEELRAHEDAARKAREAAASAESTADKLAAEARALDQQIAEAQSQVDALADDIEAASERTRRLQAEVDALSAQIDAKQAEIATKQAEYDQQLELLSGRMQSAYKKGDLVYLELLLDSQSIEDLIARTALVQRVIESNIQLADSIQKTKVELEKAKAELERDLEAVDAKRAEAQAEEDKLRELRSQHQAKRDSLKRAQEQKNALVAENKANAARLRAQAEAEEAESARIARELYGSGSGYFAGVMAFPVPGFEQTPNGGSAFGYRVHPILGYSKMHTGIDISGGAVGKDIYGATIVAAADGTVISAGYRGGYGYCTMIDHGNGVVSLYAHQESGSISVSNGDRVSKRDPIGKVGSTGLSTGPHLHFEVRVNGSPVDPMKYLK